MKASKLTKANIGDTIVVRGQVSTVDGETCGAFPVAFVQDGTPQAWLPANTEVDLVEQPFKPDAGGWLPIESAPKDGTSIDLWCAPGLRVPGCYWTQTDAGEWGWAGEDDEQMLLDNSFTHWRPLPPPPGASAAPIAPTPGAGDTAAIVARQRRALSNLAEIAGAAESGYVPHSEQDRDWVARKDDAVEEAYAALRAGSEGGK